MSLKKKLFNSLKLLEKNLKDSSLEDSFSKLKSAIGELEEEITQTKSFDFPQDLQKQGFDYAVFSDGACRGNPGPGAWGVVIQDAQGNVSLEQSDYDGHTTNNKMEMSGAIEGLLLLESHLDKNLDGLKICLVTDSKYIVNGMKSWVEGWKRRGWKKADKKAPENLELWKSLDEINQRFPFLEFIWVKGHAGHPQNERCDQLANEALDAQAF